MYPVPLSSLYVYTDLGKMGVIGGRAVWSYEQFMNYFYWDYWMGRLPVKGK